MANLTILISRKAIALYCGLAVLIGSVFGYGDEICLFFKNLGYIVPDICIKD